MQSTPSYIHTHNTVHVYIVHVLVRILYVQQLTIENCVYTHMDCSCLLLIAPTPSKDW